MREASDVEPVTQHTLPSEPLRASQSRVSLLPDVCSQFTPPVPNSVQNIFFYIKSPIDHSRRNVIVQFTKSGRGFFFFN